MRYLGCPTSPASPCQSSAALYAEEVLQRCQAQLLFVEHVIHPHTCCAAGLSGQNIARRRGDFPQDNMRTNMEGSLTESATQRPKVGTRIQSHSPNTVPPQLSGWCCRGSNSSAMFRVCTSSYGSQAFQRCWSHLRCSTLRRAGARSSRTLLDFALNWLQLAESASYELQLFTGLSNETNKA